MAALPVRPGRTLSLAVPGVVPLLAALLLAPPPAHAQAAQALPDPSTGGMPWMIALSALRDDDAYEHSLASVHFGFTETTWLSFSLGRSRAPSDETEVRADLTALGIEHDFGPAGFRLTAERWGDAENLESSDLTTEIFFGGERFRLAFAHESRDIDIYFSAGGTAPIATDLRRIGVDADGSGVNWNYRVGSRWRAYGAWMNYDYPRGMRFVPRADRLDLLSNSAVTLAYSFVDSYATLGFERALGQRLLNFDLSRDRSTIDQSTLESASVALLLPVAARMDLELMLGRSHSAGFGSTPYGGLTLLFYRGG